ncbi:MAG TPA: hypothetical protein EYF95_10160 [Flavobacteriales bacterium]|jgi:hypothetical protein|nr:hypothetical protein [Flavobacteriales bacterium]HIK68316.1 hypothetical protein [Flavobacteriales bacterium]
MRDVTIKLKLKLLDQDGFNTDWVQEGIQDCLMEAEGEEITEFKVIPESFYMSGLGESFSTEHEDAWWEDGVKTITPYGKNKK